METTSSNTPNMSYEDQQKLLQFLSELDVLKEKDPEAYSKVIESFGIGDSKDDPYFSKSSKSPPPSALDEIKFNKVDALAESKLGAINLPGGKASLGENGIETKMKGMMITPEPGFCIKSTVLSNKSKVIINLCTHAKIAIPSMKKRLDENGNEIEGMNIPMSVGPPRELKDKHDKLCTVYDIIINPKVIDEIKDDKIGKHRDFVCQLALQCVEQKYSASLDRKYKLPKLSYMGAIEQQYIQDRTQAPVIEEIASKSNTNLPKKPLPPNVNKKSEKTNNQLQNETSLPFSLFWVSCTDTTIKIPMNHEGNQNPNYDTYIDPIYLPPDTMAITSILLQCLIDFIPNESDISTKISPYILQLKVTGHKLITVYLPTAIIPRTAMATLSYPEGSVRTMSLQLTAKIDCLFLQCNEPDPGSRPWLIGQALRSDNDLYQYQVAHGNKEGRLANENSDVDSNNKIMEDTDDELLPEDKFHIKLPKNVDPYSGMKYDQETTSTTTSSTSGSIRGDGEGGGSEEAFTIQKEEEELPEDRFHKRDAASACIINQREQAVKDKWEKHEKEKRERGGNDPNVEYVDMEDYKPGGKYGPKVVAVPEAPNGLDNDLSGDSAVLTSASHVVASLGKVQLSSEIELSSTLWTELLD